MSNLNTDVMSIGPDDARQLTKHRDHQRRVSQRTVTRFAKAMREGRWRLSGATISIWIDEDGEWGDPNEWYVLNGMHRLLAVIENDTTQEFLVVFETSPDVFNTFDNGLVRTAGTIMGLTIGPENSQAISVMGGMVLRYERYPNTYWAGDMVDRDEIAAWAKAQDRERLNQCIRDYTSLRQQVKSLGHWYSALDMLVHLHSAHSDRWLEFHEGVCHGNDLKSDDPRLTLRNYIIRNQRGKGDRWGRQIDLALGLKAWNSFVLNEKRQVLMFRRDELEKSGMPKVA